MKAPLAALLATLLAAAACSRSPTGAPPPEGCAGAYAPVARFLDSTAATHGAFGAALYIVRGDQVVCEHYFGTYDGDRELPLASASKWMSAVAILTLADEGKLSLDEPVSTKLPYFTGPAATLTLRQMLSHTSGLSDVQPCMYDRNASMDACVREVATSQLLYAPGTEFRYAGASFTVAGRVAEVAAGESWNTLFAERVGTPLGWEKTRFFGTNPLLAGGAWGTVPEYARMLRMVLAGGTYGGRRILSPAAMAELSHDNVGSIPMTDTPRDDTHGYGLGVWRDEVDASGRVTQISSPGASGFVPWVDFKRNIAGIVVFPATEDIHPWWFAAAQQAQAQVRQLADSSR
jgi:CubicO group peptidase (beta-lactamase class C family)